MRRHDNGRELLLSCILNRLKTGTSQLQKSKSQQALTC